MIADKRVLTDEATVIYDSARLRVMQPKHFPGILRLDVKAWRESVGWVWSPLIALRAEDVREIENLTDDLYSVADEFTGAAYEETKRQAAEAAREADVIAADRRIIRQQRARRVGVEA